MDFDHENVRLRVENEDRLSSLPDELIHQILSFINTKFVVQTCLLSSRWKHLWKSVPCLSFDRRDFDPVAKSAKFMTNVLNKRNNQVEVSSVKLDFHGAGQVLMRKLASYAFSHNVQELNVISSPKNDRAFPPCLFSSTTLKHLSLKTYSISPCYAPKTPWDFPALTSLHLNDITLCNSYRESVDLFSKCVNLKNLTLKGVTALAQVFKINAPSLSNLVLDNARGSHINVIAPQLENLTVIGGEIDYLSATPLLSSLYYKGYSLPLWFKDRFPSLNNVTFRLNLYDSKQPYKEEDACSVINTLQELRSAKFVTLSLDIVECISSFPDLVSIHPSPFSNLICLNIDSSMRKHYRLKMSPEARNFLLENSPSAKFIMELPELKEPTKAEKAKEAREKKRAILVTEIEIIMTELQALLKLEKPFAERKQAWEKTKTDFKNLMAELEQLSKKIKMMQYEPEKRLAQFEEIVAGLRARHNACLNEMFSLLKQTSDEMMDMGSKMTTVRSLLEYLPKRQKTAMESHYSAQLQEIETRHATLCSTYDNSCLDLEEIMRVLKETPVSQDVSASQPSSSSATEHH